VPSRLSMANSQILAKRIGSGSPAEAAPCRARPVVGVEVARWLDRGRAVLEGDHTGPNGRPTGRIGKPWRRAARSYRQGRSSNANGLRWRALARANRYYLNISNTWFAPGYLSSSPLTPATQCGLCDGSRIVTVRLRKRPHSYSSRPPDRSQSASKRASNRTSTPLVHGSS
jgi:hypothetical protein